MTFPGGPFSRRNWSQAVSGKIGFEASPDNNVRFFLVLCAEGGQNQRTDLDATDLPRRVLEAVQALASERSQACDLEEA